MPLASDGRNLKSCFQTFSWSGIIAGAMGRKLVVFALATAVLTVCVVVFLRSARFSRHSKVSLAPKPEDSSTNLAATLKYPIVAPPVSTGWTRLKKPRRTNGMRLAAEVPAVAAVMTNGTDVLTQAAVVSIEGQIIPVLPASAEEESIRDPVARFALTYVGADPEAEAYWVEAINDPSLSATERQDLIEDLNEDGFPDPRHITARDLPLIASRIALIERLAPESMDDVNAEAFAEAYKDLTNMFARASEQ